MARISSFSRALTPFALQMRLIRRSRDIAAFDALASKRVEGAVFPLPLSALGRAYYEATLGESREEVSFLVEHEGEALVVFIADVEAGKLGRYGMPAELLIDRSAERVAPEEAVEAIARPQADEVRRSVVDDAGDGPSVSRTIRAGEEVDTVDERRIDDAQNLQFHRSGSGNTHE